MSNPLPVSSALGFGLNDGQLADAIAHADALAVRFDYHEPDVTLAMRWRSVARELRAVQLDRLAHAQLAARTPLLTYVRPRPSTSPLADRLANRG